MALLVQNSLLPLSDIKEFAIKPPLAEEMDSNDDYRISSAPADTGSPDCRQSVAVTGSKSTTFTSSSHSERSTGCSSLSSSTVFVAAPAGGTAPRHYESGPLSTVQPAPRHGHVVTIRINPETASDSRILNGNSSPPNNDTQCDIKKQNSKVSINQTDTINTIGKFIVNICESSDQTDSSDPIKEQYRANGCVRISVNPEAKRQDMVQKPETILKTNGEMASPYFFCSSFPCSPSNTLMSSGQCSPSDTLDSGTCSDLDGTPPPLPKKKSSKTNGTTHKRVSVTVIGATAHNRAPSVTSSGAEVDSEDSESNISCDSLNSSDLSSASLHEDTAAIAFKAGDKDKLQSDVAIPAAPKMPTLTNGNGNSSGFLPQGLLRDIRDRSAKLNAIQTEETKTSWAELDKQTEAPVAQIEPPIKIEESLTSFKLVSQVNGEAKKSKITDILSTQPIIIDTTPSYAKILPIVNESTYEDRKIQQEKQKQEKHFSYNFLYDTDKYYNFHLNENVFEDDTSEADKKKKKKSVLSVNGAVFNGSSDSEFFDEDSSEYFAGFKDYKNDDAPSTIRSAKGTIRGVKNRVRAGIKTFLQMQDTTAKSYREKDAGKVVVYTTSMGIVRGTYQKCLQVKKILRTLLVKFEERDVFMSGEYQEEIKERMRSSEILVPQIYVDGQHVGDAETIERLNECGELRRMLKPYKSADACTTCQFCGGYRLLPCPVCSGSKKSVHRNHFTAEFVALKCMNCDEVGLVKCEAC